MPKDKDKDKADYWLIMFIQGASIQRLRKARFTTTERKYKKRAVSKAAGQTILDMELLKSIKQC
jgi:hypothetical protein